MKTTASLSRYAGRSVWLALLAALPLTAPAQSVGIGTATPDTSAALDVSATTQGLLVPRLTEAQRLAIAVPATGLLVYQTDGPQPGFWYNAGLPSAPNWTLFTAVGDNLGNHTAIQPLNLQANALVGTGSDLGTAVGLGVRADGGLNLGQNGVGHNILLGYQAGQSLLPDASTGLGTLNQFSGYQAGQNNTTGFNNHFDGYQAGQKNTTSNNNQFVGSESGSYNTDGTFNYFNGYRSGFLNTAGSYNYFSGNLSGRNNLTGGYNQFTGYHSGYNNRTGSDNQFSGYESGYANSASFNHFDGYQSGYNNGAGSQNQFSGYQSGYNNTTGNYNQFSGFLSGYNNVTGSFNWGFGYLAGPTSGDLTNAGAIGYQAQVSQSNSLVLGGLGPNAVNVGIGTSSPGQRLEVTGNGWFTGDLTATGNVNMGWTQLTETHSLEGHIQRTYTLTCPAGMRTLGGGGGHRDDNIDASAVSIHYSGPDPNDPEHSWRVIMGNEADYDRTVIIYCNCARIAL